jgi:hypothetical protein
MSAGLEITIYLICALVAGIVATVVAQVKERNATAWMTAAFLFPPAVFILFALPRRSFVKQQQQRS